MEQYFNELKRIAGSNAKKEHLKSATPEIKLFFYLTYNPILISNINKIPTVSKGNFGTRTMIESIKDFADLYKRLHTREISGHDAIDAVQNFLFTVTEDAYDWYKKSLKKDLKIGISSSTLNEVFGSRFIPIFEIQLANKLVKVLATKKGKMILGFFISPKLDGLRCVYLTRNMFDSIQNKGDSVFPLDYYKGEGLYTRQGKKIVGFTHIENEYANLVSQYSVDMVDGELYSHIVPFGEIQSAVVSFKNFDEEKKNAIFHNVFAVYSRTKTMATDEMINTYTALCQNASDYICAVEQVYVANDMKIIREMHNKYCEAGYEGSMFRSVSTSYSFGRSNDLVKYKDFFEADFVIVDYEEGKEDTRFEGTLNVLWVEGNIDGKHVKSKVYGMKDAMKIELAERHKKGNLIGTKVEVKYQELSKADGNEHWAIRFGSVQKTKLDR